MKIVFLDAYTSNPGDLSWDGLRQLGECIIYDRSTPEQIVERSREADAILINKVLITREMMQQLPRLRYIGILATGFNYVDVVAAHEYGIIVTNVPAYSTPSVAQLAWAHLLNICCMPQHYTDEVRGGLWGRCPDFSFTNTSEFLPDVNTIKLVAEDYEYIASHRQEFLDRFNDIWAKYN